jgi:hypothetical protein
LPIADCSEVLKIKRSLTELFVTMCLRRNRQSAIGNRQCFSRHEISRSATNLQ